MYESYATHIDLPGVGAVAVEIRVWRRNGRPMMQRLGVCSYEDGSDLTPEDRQQVRALVPRIR